MKVKGKPFVFNAAPPRLRVATENGYVELAAMQANIIMVTMVAPDDVKAVCYKWGDEAYDRYSRAWSPKLVKWLISMGDNE